MSTILFMYSEEFDNNASYNDEQYVDYEEQEEKQQGFWNENKGLIIKIIILSFWKLPVESWLSKMLSNF